MISYLEKYEKNKSLRSFEDSWMEIFEEQEKAEMNENPTVQDVDEWVKKYMW